MALSVTQLTAKKERLSTQLEKIEETTATKVVALNKAHEERIEALNEAHTTKITATTDGVQGRKDKLAEEIADVETLLEQQVATLQAQIDAIRGISETVKTDDFGLDIDEESEDELV